MPEASNTQQSVEKKTLAILGGTGALGGGLARRWSRAGFKVIIGSRETDKALSSAKKLIDEFPDLDVTGMNNLAAAEAADLVVLTVPFMHQLDTLASVCSALSGKILIDVTVPLSPPKVGTVQMPEGGSAALIAQAFLGEDVTVVSAFQNVSALHLNDDHPIDCDVLVTGNRRAARDEVIDLVKSAGLKGWHAGPLANSVATEALTSVLISINRHHKVDGAGIVITGNITQEAH